MNESFVFVIFVGLGAKLKFGLRQFYP